MRGMTVHGRSCLRRCVKPTRATPVTYGQIGGQGALFFWGGQKCSSQSGGEGRFLTSQSGGRFLREEVFLFFFSLLSHCSLIALSLLSHCSLTSIWADSFVSTSLIFVLFFFFSLSLSHTSISTWADSLFVYTSLSIGVICFRARSLSLSRTPPSPPTDRLLSTVSAVRKTP